MVAGRKGGGLGNFPRWNKNRKRPATNGDRDIRLESARSVALAFTRLEIRVIVR